VDFDAHITCVERKNIFEALKLVEGGVVHLEDGKLVRFKVSVSLFLHDVRYFLELKMHG
jgi:hypothetical protein